MMPVILPEGFGVSSTGLVYAGPADVLCEGAKMSEHYPAYGNKQQLLLFAEYACPGSQLFEIECCFR